MALLFASVLPAATAARPNFPLPARVLLTYVASDGGICLVRAGASHAVV